MKLGGFSVFLENLAPELAKPYIDGSILSDIITYFVFTLAGAEMWQRASPPRAAGPRRRDSSSVRSSMA